MNLENSVWLHPENFTCCFSGTTHWDTLQENLTENRWQMSWGLTQQRKQRSKPRNEALGTEFLEQARKWSPALCPLTWYDWEGYWPPAGATPVSVTQWMGWCLDWWMICPTSFPSVPSLWIFFELITTAQNEHSKFRPKLLHVSKGTVNYFVNVHTTQPAKSAWWSPLLHSMSEGASSIVALSRLLDSWQPQTDCLCFPIGHFSRTLCCGYKGLKPSAATIPNSPKFYIVPVKGVLDGEQSGMLHCLWRAI